MKSFEAGSLVEHTQCIANEIKGKEPCSSSDAMGIYEKQDKEGKFIYDASCFSCSQGFSPSQFAISGVGKAFLGEGEAEGVVRRSTVKPKERITREEFEDIKSKTDQVANGYLGLPDEVFKFYGHRLEKDDEGDVVKEYYPETQGGKFFGMKYRFLLRDGSKCFGRVGWTGQASDLSGQSKFKEGGKFVLIVGGEKDKLAAYHMLYQSQLSRGHGGFNAIPVVSPTTGETSAYKQLQAQYEWLDSFENIILGFDSDEAGEQATEEALKYLPREKVKIAKWSEKDPFEMWEKGRSAQFLRDFYDAKDVVNSGIIGSGDMRDGVLEYLRLPRIPLPDYMKKLQTMMGGGIKQGRIVNIIGNTSVGKCHGKGTEVLMSDFSTKKVEDVLVGDKLMGDNGQAREVLSLVRGRDKLYKVSQVDGESYVVNSHHKLSLRAGYTTKGVFPVSKGQVVNISVQDWLGLPYSTKRSLKGYKADLHLLGDSSQPVWEPYIVGLWLADGTKNRAQITVGKADPELLSEVEDFAERNGYTLKCYPSNDREGCVALEILGGFRTKLRQLGILGDKHIPKEYLMSSCEDRLKLLSGILDGDGYLCHSKCYEVIQKSDKLAKGVLDLARSLNMRATTRKHFSKCQNFEGTFYNRMFISGEGIENLMLKVPRKVLVGKSDLRKKLNTAISVEELEDGEYFGFSLDGNHLYCLKDFTVTHNSTHSESMFHFWAMNSPEGVMPAAVSLEATKEEFWLKMAAIHLGINIDSLSDEEAIELIMSPEYEEALNNLERLPNGEHRYQLIDERDGSIERLQDQIIRLFRGSGRNLIIIDVLSDLLRFLPNDEQERHMSWQKRMAKEGLTIINILHTRKPTSEKGNTDKKVTEYDALGSSSFVQSAHINIVINRNKMAEDEVDKNTTEVDMPKCRGGKTGSAGEWYYDWKTRKVYDLEDWLLTNPDQQTKVTHTITQSKTVVATEGDVFDE